ncbi:MAG: D-tyrosyl-tRNA(Tyr) deacylase [Blastocatellia bacterium]|nr:D-tyrosyl-tRNA(Tyr) deacylase [Blastocatellia bacterium]
MRVVIQRVTKSSVTVDGTVVGQCGRGLNLLLGVRVGDTVAEAEWLANKIANLRIFEDDEGKMNRSLLDIEGSALVISQFTLYGDARKGRRPAFTDAESPDKATRLVDTFVDFLRATGVPVETGIFGAMMQVEIHNDGPVTILLEREPETR